MSRRISLLTTTLVLAEVHRLTLFRVGFQPALRALERIDASPAVTVCHTTAEDHILARQWLERLAPRPITYTDAVSFAIMNRTARDHVLGFDQDFSAAGFRLWRGRDASP